MAPCPLRASYDYDTGHSSVDGLARCQRACAWKANGARDGPIGDRGAALASRGMKPPRGFLGARARRVELDGVSDTTGEDGISNTVHPLVPGGHPIRLVRPRLAASQESLPSSSCSDAGDRCAPPAQASAARHLYVTAAPVPSSDDAYPGDAPSFCLDWEYLVLINMPASFFQHFSPHFSP